MVQAWVAQELLSVTFLEFFDVWFYKYLRRVLVKTRNWKRLIWQKNANSTTPIKYSIKLVKLLSSVWYVIPLFVIRGQHVNDITYAWSKNAMDNYALLANILSVNEYDNLTGILTYTIPHKPASYNPNITDATPMHTWKWMEEEWELVQTSWFIQKGFLQGIIDNLWDALDKQYYSQLRHGLMAYQHHPLPSTIAGAPSTWRQKWNSRKHTKQSGTMPSSTWQRLGSALTTTNALLYDRMLPLQMTTNSSSTWRKSTTVTTLTNKKC